MPLILPTAPVPASEVSPKTMIIYGPPKVGKTTMLSALPDCLLVDLENGSDYTSGLKIKLDNILQIEQLTDLIKSAKQPYKYVAIDTLDKLEEWVEAEATRRYKQTPIGKNFSGLSILELPKGAGYLHLRNVFYEMFQKLRALAPYAIFIGHVRDKNLTVEGKEVTSQDLDLTGKVRNIVCAYSDAIGYVYRDKESKLKMTFVTTDIAMCSTRAKHLEGKVFTFEQGNEVKTWKEIYV